MTILRYTCLDVKAYESSCIGLMKYANEKAVVILLRIFLRDSDGNSKTDWYWCTRLQQCGTVGAVKLCSIPDSQQYINVPRETF